VRDRYCRQGRSMPVTDFLPVAVNLRDRGVPADDLAVIFATLITAPQHYGLLVIVQPEIRPPTAGRGAQLSPCARVTAGARWPSASRRRRR